MCLVGGYKGQNGKVPCDLLFIGEGPGKNENLTGKCFVGPAGALLNQTIEHALDGLDFETPLRILLGNAVGCMPTDEDGLKSGPPCKEQLKACSQRLDDFIRVAQPKLIVAVGDIAEKAVGHSEAVSSYTPFVRIVHPSYILQQDPNRGNVLLETNIAILRNEIRNVFGDLIRGKK